MLREYKTIFLSSLDIVQEDLQVQTGVLGMRKFTWKQKRSDKECFEIGKYAVIYRSRPEERKIVLKKPFNESRTRRFAQSEKKLVLAIKIFQRYLILCLQLLKFLKLVFSPYKAKEPLRGMEVKQKEVQKD